MEILKNLFVWTTIILTWFFSICSLLPASIVEANQNIRLMMDTNIEFLSNPYRSLSRYGYNDRRTVFPYVTNRSENKNLAPISYDASNAWPQTSRMPNPSQEQLLKIPATGSWRCYNDDPLQGRISHSDVENYRSVMIHFKGSTYVTVTTFFASDGIQTPDLPYAKWTLYQLNHCCG